MSAERLKNLVEQGNLINLNIVSDSLGTLLNEIAQMLVEQQRQLGDIGESLELKHEIKDFNRFATQWRIDKENVEKNFANIEDKISKLEKDIDHKSDELRAHIDASVDGVIISVDTRIDEKIGNLESETMILSQKVEDFDSKNREQPVSSVQKQDMESLKKRIAKLESDMTTISLSGGTVDTTIIDAMREEIERKIDEIQSSLYNNGPLMGDLRRCDGGIPCFGGGELLGGIEPIEENESCTDEITELKKSIESLEAKIEEQTKSLVTRNAWRSEVALVERMFEKMRLVVTQLKDEVADAVSKCTSCVKKDDLEGFIEGLVNAFLETKQIVATGPPLKCVSYGESQKSSKLARKTGETLTGTLPVLLVSQRRK